MPLPHVCFVGAQKGGVGKTTLSNILMDYFRERGQNARAFDTESPKGVLKRFHPAQTTIIDLEHTDGHMALFDGMMASPLTLVDMRAGILTDTIDLIHKLGAVRLVEEGKLRMSLMHVISGSIASMQEIEEIAAALGPRVRRFLVLNHVNEAGFFAKIASVNKEGLEGSSTVLNIPVLNATAMQHVDAANMPFAAFGKDETQSFTMRGHVNHWFGKVVEQFDAARLIVPE